MAGSKRGKQSKGKGTHKSKNSDTIEKKPESSISNAVSTSTSGYDENELERFLYIKIETLYAKSKDSLLKIGYSLAEIEKLILSVGLIHGQMDHLSNIMTNSIAFIEKRIELKRQAFQDMDELYKSMFEALVGYVMRTRADIRRYDAMWYLLVRKWGRVPPNIEVSDSIPSHGSYEEVGIMKRINYTHLQESYLVFNVLNLRDDMQRKAEDPVITQDAITSCSYETYLDQFLDSNSDGLKNALILDLVKSTRDLEEKSNEQKEWAQRKLVDSARWFSKHFMELNLLRREACSDKDKMKDEKLPAEKEHVLKLTTMEHYFRKVNFEANFITDYVRRLETQNAQIRADPEALTSNGSESERELKEIRKRKKKWKKNLSDVEKQISNNLSQCDEEKQRAITLRKRRRINRKSTPYIVPFGIIFFLPVQFQNDVVLSTSGFIVKWRQEKARMFEIGKANARTELLRLQQKLELGSQAEMDNCRRLEDELMRLHLCQQMAEVQLTENARSSESSATMEYSSERRIGLMTCMMCLQNDQSVVLLPCAHQVLCFPCFERNCSAVGANCPVLQCSDQTEHYTVWS
ncbi:hypothetical protein MIMGU_mgv1a018820mg [Erythranthe guttata]|uniref:RING-type domain-containing protein n=1 Tax=Erythranthe guttata TaxID=4155 RepID=A0A022QQC8_ERYGU|nr:hypothetical protein MIMGU_mgv1a018820mg [Erythranthe guttata]